MKIWILALGSALSIFTAQATEGYFISDDPFSSGMTSPLPPSEPLPAPQELTDPYPDTMASNPFLKGPDALNYLQALTPEKAAELKQTYRLNTDENGNIKYYKSK